MTEKKIRVESYKFKGNELVRDDQWITKAQQESFSNAIETEEGIRNKEISRNC